MLVTILEIVVFMAVAAFIGLLLGWVLRGSMGSEQAELAQTRSQLRALKKTLREQQVASKAEAASDAETGKTQQASDSSRAPVKTAVEAKTQPTSEPASVTDSKPKQVTASKPVEKKPLGKKSAVTKVATPAKKKSTAKSKASRSKRKSLAEREADQAIGKQAFAEVVARIGASDTEDNLTKIYGVGKRYAEMLNELGLHSYKQIAALKKADLKTLAAALGVLDDRIEQEDWVSSAKVVLKEQASKAKK